MTQAQLGISLLVTALVTVDGNTREDEGLSKWISRVPTVHDGSRGLSSGEGRELSSKNRAIQFIGGIASLQFIGDATIEPFRSCNAALSFA